jgi:hypothetical protein
MNSNFYGGREQKLISCGEGVEEKGKECWSKKEK